MSFDPTKIFMPSRPPRREPDPVSPSQRSSMEERRRALKEGNPGGYRNESGFGPIDGIPLFKTWKYRDECARDRMHAPPKAGIWGGKEGAYSIMMSGGFEDDVDGGETITYTGAGGFGEDNRYGGGGGNSWGKNIQTEDQSFDHKDNRALLVSYHRGKPVRVVRGSRLNTYYAPYDGYRYDGIYKVTDAYMAKGKNGVYDICRFELKREPNQGKIPRRPF